MCRPVSSDPPLAALAAELFDAEATRVPITRLSARHDLSPADAYAIQRHNIARREVAGVRVLGHKVGLTARSMQELFGIDEPDFGHLMDDMFAFENRPLSMSRFIQPRIEIEPAFVLDRRLQGPGVTVADVVRATDVVMPSFEIIDSRIGDWDIGLVDTIADNGSSAAVVLGGRATELAGADLRALEAELEINGEVVQRGSTREIWGSPLNAVAWLANAVGRFGVALEAGHVVLPGTCVPAVAVQAGDHCVARFELLGEVEVTFTEED
jgi:2-keto-4-pentenoate hydratase